MGRRHRSRREELTDLRVALRGKGATTRHIAHVIRARYNVNSRVAYRHAHGLTQQQVSDAWNQLWPPAPEEATITHKHISYWEAWPGPSGRAPSPEVLNRLARIYQTSAAELLDGEDHTDHSRDDPRLSAPSRGVDVEEAVSADPSDVLKRVDAFIAESGSQLVTRESDYQQLVKDLVEWACRLKRRDILQWLSWAAASATAAPVLDDLDDGEKERTVLALASPNRVDHNVIDHIEAVLWRCMRQDDSLGPQAALDTVLAQRRLARALIPEATGQLKDRLLSLFANLSRFAGWLSFDLNNHDAAADYYETARTAAHEAQDTELGAFVLCNMSHLASWRGKARIGIDHALAAQGWARQTDDVRLRAYAYDVAARGYAMDGQPRAAEQALERARDALSVADGHGGRDTLVYFYNSGQLASTQSSCHLWLGRPVRGAEVAEEALTMIEGPFVRNLALTSLRLGVCHLRSPKPDPVRGSRGVADAIRLAAHNRSPRLAERLQRGWKELAPWRDEPEVRGVLAPLQANVASTRGREIVKPFA